MELELKHLAPYLPYGLKGNYEVSEVVPSAKFELRNKELRTDNIDFFLSFAKPILRPISDLKKNEFPFKLGTYTQNFKFTLENTEYQFIERMIELHFDVFGLIEKGLAIDINTLPQSSE